MLLLSLGRFKMADLFEHFSAPAPGIQLNPEQRAAAQHGDGPLIVVAGAGTGKTRVITERIRYLLATQPELSGKEILGLTFTDKAAARGRRNGNRTRERCYSQHFPLVLQRAPSGTRP
jgi:superfamily I DNA/RNA helicase